MSNQECRAYVQSLSTTKMVAERLKVIPRWVNFMANELNLGIFIGPNRVFDEDDIKKMERRRAESKYGKGRAPKPPTAPVIKLSPAYEEELARIRGNKR